MKKYIFFAMVLFAFEVGICLEPVPPSYIYLKKTPKGFRLRIEDAPTPEGGSYIQYQILNRKKRVIKTFPVSDTQFDAHAANGDIHGEKISLQECQSTAKKIEIELRKLSFKNIKTDFEQCGKNRKYVVQ
jgi:hypothetical protein